MKYYIFGSDNPKIKTLVTKHSGSVKNNINDAMDEFDKVCAKNKYKHLYLVADFENYKQNLFDYASLSEDSINIPFLIISEYHRDDHIVKKDIRRDTILLVIDGFTEHYYSNAVAMDRFEKYINEKVPCSLYLKYKYYDIITGTFITKHHKVACTIDLLNEKKTPLKRVIVNQLIWESCPLEPNIKIQVVN